MTAELPQTLIPHPEKISNDPGILNLDSTLKDLTLFRFQVEASHQGYSVAQRFEQYPAVPGVILTQEGQYLGMISRQRLLEYLLRPQGIKLFLSQPLQVLHSYARIETLILSAATPILSAAQQALRRSRDRQSEPLVVQLESQTFALLDIHELHIAYWQIRGIETQVRYERTQAQMIQTEKMASLGRLVDGVAHEILDPVGFIWGNVAHISSYTEQLLELLSIYETSYPATTPAIATLTNQIELDYLKQDLPLAIASVKAGADRLKKLVTSLQNFCHIDEVYPKPIDLHDSLDGILLLLKSQLNSKIQIVRNYGHLPPVPCYAGQLSQVFMNILSNAVDVLLNQAIYQQWAEDFQEPDRAATVTPQPKPQITLTTQVRSHSDLCHPQNQSNALFAENELRWVSIRIADNGPGLTPEQQQKQDLRS